MREGGRMRGEEGRKKEEIKDGAHTNTNTHNLTHCLHTDST